MSVVVGFIPTEVGQAALLAAREQAELRGAPLVVVNVQLTEAPDDPRNAAPSDLEAAQDLLRDAAVRVEVLQEEAHEDIADTLLDVTARKDAELLVLGNRHGPSVGRPLLGLTLQRLLLDAECEVLVV